MNFEEENFWLIEAKLLTKRQEMAEEIVKELESMGFSVKRRSIVFYD